MGTDGPRASIDLGLHRFPEPFATDRGYSWRCSCDITSCVITKTAAAVRESFCSFFETEVTLMFIKSSIFIAVRSTPEPVPCSDFCAKTGAQKRRRVSERAHEFWSVVSYWSVHILTKPAADAPSLDSELDTHLPGSNCSRRAESLQSSHPEMHLHCSGELTGRRPTGLTGSVHWDHSGESGSGCSMLRHNFPGNWFQIGLARTVWTHSRRNSAEVL